jgi:transcriptional regulator with XRE-family HTH domain
MPKSTRTTPQGDSSRKQPPRRAQPAFPTLEPFARRLESLRLERRLTQRALAARAGISANHWHDIVHARANPSVMVLLRLAHALSVPIVELFDPVPPADERRSILLADLEELAAANKRLTDAVERLTTDRKRSRSRSRDTKRQQCV